MNSYQPNEHITKALALNKVWYQFKDIFNQTHEGAWDMGTSWETFSQRVAEWVYNHPESGCDVSSCESGDYSASFFVYIPHQTEAEYWGTTVLYLTNDAPPVEIFL